MKIAICDDDGEELRKIEIFCRKTVSEEAYIYKYKNAEDLKRAIVHLKFCPDLVILDIEMPEESGIEVKKWLEKNNYTCSIVFLTCHEEMMQEAFGRNVIGFLNKSNDQDRLKQLIKDTEKTVARVIEIPLKIGYERVEIKAILYIKSADKYSEVYCWYSGDPEKRKLLSNCTMSQWEKSLSDEFFYRISRMCIVNFMNIKSIHKQVISMSDDTELTIPKGKIREFRQMYFAYVRKWVNPW